MIKTILTLSLLILSTTSFAMEKLFYILRSNAPSEINYNKNAYDSFTKHANQIDILVSQAYQIDANGIVWGFINPDVLSYANTHSVKLMPMITNPSFNKEKAHAFLSNPAAQTQALKTILDACDKNHFYGIQFDFEMIGLNDRDALTQFYKNAADTLHKKGYKVSFAIAPVVEDQLFTTDFQKRIYENWEGAYDVQALGSFADFLSVMTYNQHGEGTTPGPTATQVWTEAVIKNMLRHVPAQKISLGIPSYSTYWYTSKADEPSKKIVVRSVGIDFDQVNYLLKKYQASLQWDTTNQVNYSIFNHGWLNEYIFVEDAKSFQAKLDLVKKYHLRGISVFCVGLEDPQTWNVLQTAKE